MLGIYRMDIRKLDLNLLVLLDVLLSEANVTRAAQRVHLSQPAMSAALKRLRTAFNDPLLVRTRRGMEPTQKAKDLIGPVRAALGSIQAAIEPSGAVNESRLDRTFAIAATEYVSFLIMPPLIQTLRQVAPNVALTISRIDLNSPFEPLRLGNADLVIGAHLSATSLIHKSDLFSDTYVCIARKNHPRVASRLSYAQLLETPQLIVQGQVGGVTGAVENVFRQRGIPRKPVITLPDYLAVPHIIIGTDLIMNVAERVAVALIRQFPIQIVKYPFPRERFSVSQFWHQRSDAEPAHRWLRDTIERVSMKIERKGL
jgi:DNA-binding transcriptional LysR family regulator